MTDKELGVNRIRAGVFLHPEEIKITQTGAIWNPYFIERVEDATRLFQELFYEPIVKEVGELGWAIQFTQVSQEDIHWYVDIFMDSKEHFTKIIDLVNRNVPPDFRLGFWFRGDLSDYIGTR